MEEEYEHLDEPIPEEDEEEDILSAGHEMSDEDEEEAEVGVEEEEHTSRYPYHAISLEPPRIELDLS